MVNLSTIQRPFQIENIERLFTSCWPLLISAIALVFVGMGLRDPWPADEPRFALIAKEMVETGQWFFPARAQELYPDKPPIFMWSIALCYWVSGSLRFSFLLPSALSALLTIFLVYDIGKRLWTKKIGLIAGWLLLFSFQFLLQAKTAQIDAMVCAWITVGCYGILRYCLIDGKYRWFALACFFMGIGVITKGVGFLPLFMLIPYGYYRFKTISESQVANLTLKSLIFGLLIMLSAIGLWFIPMLTLVELTGNHSFEAYRDNILLKQTVTRYADSWHHIKPAWYYLLSVIPIFWLPLSLMIPWLIKPWVSAFKKNDPRIILPIIWVVIVLIFFSLSPGKRGVYILPALPMLVIAIAPYYKGILKAKTLRTLLVLLSFVISCFLIIVSILGFLDVDFVTKLTDKISIEPWYLFLSIGVLSLLMFFSLRHLSLWSAWPAFFISLWLIYSTYGYGLRNNISTPINIYQQAQRYLDKNAEIAIVSFSEQFILFSPFRTYHFGYHTNLELQLEAANKWLIYDNRYILIEDSLVNPSCFDVLKSIELGFAHRRNWILLPYSAKRPSCAYENSDIPVYSYKGK